MGGEEAAVLPGCRGRRDESPRQISLQYYIHSDAFMPCIRATSPRRTSRHRSTRRAPLFTYSDTGRIQSQVLNGLRVSGGAPRTVQTTKSAFPKDPYSTTITPYRQDVSRSFGIESSLPAIAVPSEYVRAALPMDCWIMFTPTNSFNKVGKLVIRRLKLEQWRIPRQKLQSLGYGHTRQQPRRLHRVRHHRLWQHTYSGGS